MAFRRKSRKFVVLLFMNMKTNDISSILTNLIDRIRGYRDHRPMASRGLQLQVFAMDTQELTGLLRRDVLEVVNHEALLTADVDIDFVERAESVGQLRYDDQREKADNQEPCRQLNEALDALAAVLNDIAAQIIRRHTDQEYERMYERERARYIGQQGTKIRRKFDSWLDDVCLNELTMEDLDEYRAIQMLKLFGCGVFLPDVTRQQHGKRYHDEIDLDRIDLSKLDLKRVKADELQHDLNKHYRSLCRMVNYVDGFFVADPRKVGHFFFSHRNDFAAQERLTDFMRYMFKIELVQAEMQRLLEQRDPFNDLPQTRQAIILELDRLIGLGDWVNTTPERICVMMRQVLGVGRIPLTPEEQEMSETLWSMLDTMEHLRITWLNLVGYFSGHQLLNDRKGGPALCKMFFGTTDKYQNINKGRPQYDRKSRKYAAIQPLLNKFRP